MRERSVLEQLKEQSRAQRTRWLVWAESLLIFGLLVWVSHEYEYNMYLQSWLATTIRPLSFLFNGTLAGLYAGGLVGYAIALYAGRKQEEEKKILERIRENKIWQDKL